MPNQWNKLFVSQSFIRRVSKRRKLRFFRSKQFGDLPPRRLVSFREQLPSEVLNVHLRNVYTLVHGDPTVRRYGPKSLTLTSGKIKRTLFQVRTRDL